MFPIISLKKNTNLLQKFIPQYNLRMYTVF